MFLLGFLSGISASFLSILLFLLIINKKQKNILEKEEVFRVEVEEESINKLIKEKRDNIIRGTSVGFGSNYKKVEEGVKVLTEEIAKSYFPKSKYPKYELTIEETIELNIHISNRLLDELKKKRYKLLRELRISQILYLNDAKNNIMEKEIVAKLNKYKVVDIVRSGWMVYNIANPIYWVKKLAITGGMEAALRSFGVLIINTVGEELNSVYSKSFKMATKEFERQKLEYKKK